MNTLLLRPSDILFFRDGRPMGGSLAGHGAAWPLPSVTNAALHAALWRAGIADVHSHRRGRSSNRSENAERDRLFGSLTTAGPFPVYKSDDASTWFFPRPLDAGEANSPSATLLPLGGSISPSSLPAPLQYPVANTSPPTKEPIKPWWNEAAWNAYLGNSSTKDDRYCTDSDFSGVEHSIGIGIDAETFTQDGDQFYSAHYLRLRDEWSLGLFTEALDKINGNPEDKRDLIRVLLDSENHILVGGQQRLCSVEVPKTNGKLPLPLGMGSGFTREGDKHLVKWILLSPAIFPVVNDHQGGWLPSWINHEHGGFMLLDGPGKNAARRQKVAEGRPIPATLVAAMTGKPVPVSGYALDNGLDDRKAGPKTTHLAVPAGSVYYFECAGSDAAQALAATLNWHGSGDASTIHNRRSTLMGEKGFGLGVCGTWNYHAGNIPQSL